MEISSRAFCLTRKCHGREALIVLYLDEKGAGPKKVKNHNQIKNGNCIKVLQFSFVRFLRRTTNVFDRLQLEFYTFTKNLQVVVYILGAIWFFKLFISDPIRLDFLRNNTLKSTFNFYQNSSNTSVSFPRSWYFELRTPNVFLLSLLSTHRVLK